MSLTRKGFTTFATFAFKSSAVQVSGKTRREPDGSRDTHNHLHETAGAVGDEEHLLAVIGQFGQHCAGLLGIADVFF